MSSAEKISARRHRWATILGFVAIILLWRAIWDLSEEWFTPTTALFIGLIMIGGVGVLEKDYIKELF
jgi:hypothetical protein